MHFFHTIYLWCEKHLYKQLKMIQKNYNQLTSRTSRHQCLHYANFRDLRQKLFSATNRQQAATISFPEFCLKFHVPHV